MNKKVCIWILAVFLLLALLFVPIPTGVHKDGGSKEYTALTYKIVQWNRLTGDTKYNKTCIYFFPDNLRSIDTLWQREEEKISTTLIATVIEINGSTVIVQPVVDSGMLEISDKVSVSTSQLEPIEIVVGSVVQITYTGAIMESYPAQINAISWSLSGDLRHMAYTEPWLDKNTAEKYDHTPFDHIVITRIYNNCFFAKTVIPMPYEIKLNGQLTDEWCVGDQVSCAYENTYYDQEGQRMEADMLTIEPSDWEPQPGMAYKPVIYLYPEAETDITVKLALKGRLTCTYPAYDTEWQVTAAPDGTLTDTKGQTYNYLYWEGETNAQWDMSEGFCVKGEDTAAFLEQALEKLNLSRKEANEFIVYWLPQMEQNAYNIISFQTDSYTESAPLQITPTPDTLIRVFMTWKGSDSFIALPEQKLTAPERNGFTVVEWGGTELK